MTPCTFAEVNTTYAENQKPYMPFPVYRRGDRYGAVIGCWRLTWRERLAVLWHGVIWHEMLTFNQPLQPQLLRASKPEMPR